MFRLRIEEVDIDQPTVTDDTRNLNITCQRKISYRYNSAFVMGIAELNDEGKMLVFLSTDRDDLSIRLVTPNKSIVEVLSQSELDQKLWGGEGNPTAKSD